MSGIDETFDPSKLFASVDAAVPPANEDRTELEAMLVIGEAFGRLDPDARARVLSWVVRTLGAGEDVGEPAAQPATSMVRGFVAAFQQLAKDWNG